MSHRWSRRWGQCALVVCALTGVAGEPAAQQPVDSAEQVVLELRIGRLASRTVAAYRVRSEALVPLSQFLQLAEVRYEISPQGVVVATLDPGRVRLVVDAARDTVAFGSRRVRLEPGFRRLEDGEVYIGAERLGDLLSLQLHVDWAELTVTVMDPATLPVARRVYREAARRAFLRRGDLQGADFALGLERPKWDGLVFDYSVMAPSRDVLDGGSYSAALGGDAWGGALQIGVSSVGPVDDGHARLEGSWTGVFRHPALAQVRLGTGITSGPRARQQHGIMVTNAPWVRPSYVGAIPYGGRLEPGWSVEAYRGGDLVAFDSTDGGGRFLVELPVRYGENPVDFVAYGPFGEIRHFNRTYRVFEELLPARRFEYGLSAGVCTERCDALANVDLRYGVSRWWTVAAGADRVWRDTQPDLVHPYVALAGSPTTDWGVTLEAVSDAFARAAVQFEPSLALHFGASATRFDRDVPAPFFTTPGRRAQWAVSAFFRPAPERGYAFFEALLEGEETVDSRTLRGRLGASALTDIARVLPYVRWQRVTQLGVTDETFLGVTAFVLPRPQWGPVLGKIWMRAGAELQRVPGVTSAGLVLGRDLWTGVRLEVGTTWDRTSGTAFSLNVASYLPAVRMLTSVQAAAGQAAAASQSIQGSLLWDRTAGRIAAAPGPSLQRSGLAGRVFLDENANGRRDPGEPPVPGVRILVGTQSTLADSNGIYRVWDLMPFEPVLVRVDSLSLDSPLLVPGFGSVSVQPGPNRFRALEVPIAVAGVLEGRVVRADNRGGAARGMGGVTLMLTQRRTGLVRRFVTFTDGDFYLLGVTAGDYELKVDPVSLTALNMTSEPFPITLAPAAGGVGRSGLVLILRPKS